MDILNDNIRNTTAKRKLQLVSTRAMLGLSYWRIGQSLKSTSILFAAGIHFELSVRKIKACKDIIPYKLIMLQQHYNCGYFKYNYDCVSITDVIQYQLHLLDFNWYLHSLTKTPNNVQRMHFFMSVDEKRKAMLFDLLSIFGCSLDARFLKHIYFMIADIAENARTIWQAIVYYQNALDILVSKIHASQFNSQVLIKKDKQIFIDPLFKMIKQKVNNETYKKIKLKVKTKAKTKMKRANIKVTKATIESGKYLQNDPKLLLLAACDYKLDLFLSIVRPQNTINEKEVIEMIKSTNLIRMNVIDIYRNLNRGNYLFELLKYCCDGNINLCTDQKIKIIFHWYYAQYYQIITSYKNDFPFEGDSKYIGNYNEYIRLIVTHLHCALSELMRLKHEKDKLRFGSQIAIEYISFLLAIWDKPSLFESTKNAIKHFWSMNFDNCNDIFIPWLKLHTKTLIETPKTCTPLDMEDIMNLTQQMERYSRHIDAIYLYALLLFKIGKYDKAYQMLEYICRETNPCSNDDRECPNYIHRNDYCLQVDCISKALQETMCLSMNVKRTFPISKYSNFSRFCGFDQDSLNGLFGLFTMNIRPLDRIDWSLKLPSKAIRQIRTSFFFLSMRLGTDNSNKNGYGDYNYERLYWIQFGMVSIGIQSLLWFDCEKFEFHDQMDFSFGWSYDKIEQYLHRFVINYIESGLKWPLLINKRVCRSARLCLMLAYFVVNEKDKLRSIFNHLRFESIDNVGKVVQHIIDYSQQMISEKHDDDHKENLEGNEKLKRMWVFVTYMNELQNKENELTITSTSRPFEQRICNVLNRCCQSNINTNSNINHFNKWKNSILNRDRMCNYCNKDDKDLRVCKRCKKTYYCSKKCQKSDWSEHKHLCS